jgi:hypothetical protein
MISQALGMIFPLDAMPSRARDDVQETVRDYLQRLKDELLWPRILVRKAPPPDEVQPIAPDRF